MGNFMGVVTRETRRLRPYPTSPPPPAPAICCEARSHWGRWGALLRAPMLRPRRLPPLSTPTCPADVLPRMSGSFALAAPTVPGRAPRREPGVAGGPRPAHSLACGLCTPHQPREGRSVGSQPGNRAPSQRGTCQAAVPPLGRETGAHGPSGVWAAAQLARPGAGAGSGGLPGRSSLPSPGWAAEVHVLTLWGGFEFSPH